jgi:Helitron helicase-like domain at N-terminus/PIF1-like helicase
MVNKDGVLIFMYLQMIQCKSHYLQFQVSLIQIRGENGDGSQQRKITQRAFYSYRLHQRFNSGFKILHHAGRLFQEFIVDAYAQIEQNRLRYLRTNQNNLRVDLYKGLADAAADGTQLSDIGNKTILPSSFTGGPRHIQQLYYDAMAIVRSHTKPDLFITMTCNPRWEEITANLEPGQTAQDRPDLITRVFHLKLSALLEDLLTNGVLGRVIAHMYVIEFQKRGMPHVHILLILDRADKPHTLEDIDTIVSAQLPDHNLYPELYETITSCMLHGPCGVSNVNAPCMVDGKCSKRYPKEFCEETKITSDKYPEYKRPNNGASVTRGGHTFTNQYVIPYNPYLCAKYNCHINIEIANGILAVKYLYKYIYKGHDRSCISIQRDDDSRSSVDEIQDYLDARYVSACEACWRIFDFPLHHHHPSVQRLQLHLPDMQTIVFDPDQQTAIELLQQHKIRTTTLTAFFEACCQYSDIAADLLYPDFPSKFVWRTKDKSWRPRKQGFSIGRVYFAVPSDGERYYLRMLLYTVKCPSSFEDLRSYQGALYPTFQEACLARGLLESDDEWDTCLSEAGFIQSGSQLRHLFAMILINNSPADPLALFNKHLSNLSDDCKHKLQHRFHIDNPSEIHIISLTLHYLQILLQQSGKSLTDYNLPSPMINFDDLNGISRILAEELNYDRMQLREKWEMGYEMANVQQKHILDVVTTAIDSNIGHLFFIDGPGGTGKTFVENLLLSYVRSTGGIALAVASSGIASILLDGGRTGHSRFKIPLDIQQDSTCDIKTQTTLADLIRRTKLIIWDEAPAQHRYCFEAVDRTFKDLRHSKQWFGGITMVFAGIYLFFESSSNHFR